MTDDETSRRGKGVVIRGQEWAGEDVQVRLEKNKEQGFQGWSVGPLQSSGDDL